MLYCSRYYDDCRAVLKGVLSLDQLYEKKILITGATGLIGSSLVDLCLTLNETNHARIEIYAGARSIEKFSRRFEGCPARESLHFLKYDAEKPFNTPEEFDYIVHCAGHASPAAYSTQPVETMMTNIYGVYQLLLYARDRNVKRLLYVSSSEVYGKKETCESYNETEYGYVDILNPRSCYPSAKRASETLCAAFQREYGVDSVIVRPGHIYGPTATSQDNRVSSAFAYDAALGKDLVMKSNGSQIRSYCHVLDCATAMLTVLCKGKTGEAYNISNSQSIISIRKMAECFAKHGQVKLRFAVPDIKEAAAFNPMDRSDLKSDKLENLGWRGYFNAETGIKETLEVLKECLNNQ